MAVTLYSLFAFCLFFVVSCHEAQKSLEVQFQKLATELQDHKDELASQLRDHKKKLASELQDHKNELASKLQDHKEEIASLKKEVSRLQQACECPENKVPRTRSDDPNAWQTVVSQMTLQMTQVEAELQALKNGVTQESLATGTNYVRWGNHECPATAQLIYSGDIGGSLYIYTGAAVDYLCLPQNPVFDNHPLNQVAGSNHNQELYGAEYETGNEGKQDLEARCAVCRIPRSSTLMVPATTVCPVGYATEYTGYLMSGAPNLAAANQFICVDRSEDYEQGTNANLNGKLLYYTVTRCGSLSCPPYINDKIVSCVVCSK